ncbi:hypothetical protein FB45DRAFT_1053937 [Roridomyces roridus]|uniref:Fungal-type protein kinase domain-containing protein n=1 Tax=Roridomyces roridus TaxID=1738132 RepID=A0AAD7C7K1_9AGAR|nr:hypothetical protein FB45DRAFT_1053937 [Roridomyces roridus]
MTNSSSEAGSLPAQPSPTPDASDASAEPATPPQTPNPGIARAVQATPGQRKVHIPATSVEQTTQDDAATRRVWKKMLLEHFTGEKDVSEFLKAMGSFRQSSLQTLINRALTKLQAAAQDLQDAEHETGMTDPLLAYLKAIVSRFSKKTRPTFHDTHATPFDSVDKQQHYTKPDITGTRPGMTKKPAKWGWTDAGTVIELKYKTEIFNEDGTVNKDNIESIKALIQLGKSARSLLMASGSCHVYVLTLVGHRARIFRFDRSSFCVTKRFDLTQDFVSLPTFLWRLYNPENKDTCTRMYGGDDTISLPNHRDKKRMFGVLERTPFYHHLSFAEATKDSLWIRAVRFVEREGAARELEVVRCFTFGGILSISDGLFSRATRVHRVVLEEDADEDSPTIYALKDAWPQTCRRPEVDFYDFIAEHVRRERDNPQKARLASVFDSFAQCHGSVDLSDLHLLSPTETQKLRCNSALHCSVPGVPDHADVDPDIADQLARKHTRLLLTPVGGPLKKFKTSQSLVQALFNAINQHRIVYQAGLIHRDVSEGNVLLREVSAPRPEHNGFLLDWDYAQFTAEGLAKFKEWFPGHHRKDDVQRNLKDMTGTFPFMAIEIVRQLADQDTRLLLRAIGIDENPVMDQDHAQPSQESLVDQASSVTDFSHRAHHDLESFYWLLVWMVIRHTGLVKDPLACRELFGHHGDDAKMGHLHKVPKFDRSANPPLYDLLQLFRAAVLAQNPEASATVQPPQPKEDDPDLEFEVAEVVPPLPPVPVLLDHQQILGLLSTYVRSAGWPTDDPGQEYILPSVFAVHHKVLEAGTQERIQSLTSGSGSKRSAVEFDVDEEPGEEPQTKKKRSETQPMVNVGQQRRSGAAAGGSKGAQKKK